MTGCRTCGGTFTGPVGTAAEALKFSANVGRELPTCPALETRATDIAPDTDGENESMIKGDVEPIIFRISSRPHAPAVPSAPSTQARKGAPLFENFIGLKGFSPSLRPFRAWVLGADRSAGAWGSDAVRNVVGKIGAIPYGVSIAGTSDAFYENGTALGWQGGPYGFQGVYMDISRAVPTGPQNVPPHNWQPVILYLGRPK